MERIRWWLLALVAWLFLIYSVERISEPINIASFVYVLVFILAVGLIALPGVHRWPLSHWLPPVLAVYLGLKIALDYPIAGPGLPVTVTELVAIVGTGFLIQQAMTRLAALQGAVARLILPVPKESVSFEIAQGVMYREIRRARHHHRSAALLAISPTPSSLSLSLDRFTEEAVRALSERYVTTRLAHLLVEELEDYNIVAQQNGSFIVLLPEAGTDEAGVIVGRLQQAAAERLGLNLRVGRAHFPQDAVTFDQLVADAEEQMAEYGTGPEQPADREPLVAEDQPVVQI